MANSIDDVRASVRSVTEYDASIISDADLDDVISEAESEISHEIGDYDLNFYNGEETFDQDRALVWLSILFAKIKAGEIHGIDMQVGSLQSASLSHDDKFYFNQFQRKLHSFDGVRGFGSITSTREDRTYGYE